MAAGKPKFTILTVCYNSEKTIRDTIESVLSQTCKDFEYVVVDGNSTDRTLEIIQSYGDRIRWISEPDSGMYEAINKGIRMAAGQWIHILNSDDFYATSDVLDKILVSLDAQKTNYCNMYQLWPSGRKRLLEYPLKKWPRQKWQLYWAAYVPHPGLIVSAEQYSKVGLYDTRWRIASDHDMILRLLKHYPPNYISLPLTYMRIGGLSAQQLKRSAYEFMQVTTRHGLPKWFAYMLYVFKRLIWKIRHKNFWRGEDEGLPSDSTG